MAKYVMQEMNISYEEGKKKLYPRLIEVRQVDFDKLLEHISKASGLSKGAVTGVLSTLAERMAVLMADGCTVKIDGLGRFTPTLALKKGVEREESDEQKTRRNAASIEVGGLKFVPEKEFLRAIDNWMSLERSPYHHTIRSGSCPYTPAERKQLLLDYLHSHASIDCATYMQLTSLKRTAATTELRRWSQGEESVIQAQGRVPHKVYTLK